MTYIFYRKEGNKNKRPVYFIHNQPELLSEEQKKKGVEIEKEPPKKEKKEGYIQKPFYDEEKGKAFYDYVEKKKD